MFNVGEIVIYGAQGICKISGIETKQIGKSEADYYVLRPLFNENTALFVPIENAVLTAKMQSTLTKTEAENLIKDISNIDVIKLGNETEKQIEYKNILSSCDRQKLIALIKTIRTERDVRRENSKKLNIIDEQTLRKAETLFYNEMAFVYGVLPEEVKNVIDF